MPVEINVSAAKRILQHGDTPAAYTEWREYLPLLGERDMSNLSEELTHSSFAASEPLGCARERFRRILLNPDESLLNRWMDLLASTSADDFRDFHIPWFRNLKSINRAEATNQWLDCFVQSKNSKKNINSPDSVIIELNRSCNFSCVMCSSRTGGYNPKFTMPLEEFGEIIRVLSPNAKTLRINGYGETTLIPNIQDYLNCLDTFSYKGQREIITNLSGKNCVYEALVKSGFFIFGSWDSSDPKLFESIRVGSHFSEVHSNLLLLSQLLAEQPYRLNLIATIQKENIEQIIPITQLAIQHKIGLLLFNMVNESDGSPWMDKQATLIHSKFEEAYHLAKSTKTVIRIPDHIGSKKISSSIANRTSGTRCNRPWREIMVNYDGELTCCNMFNPFSYGILRHKNLHLDTQIRFNRLWNGANAMFFREVINTSTPHPYCEGCYFLYADKTSEN